MNIYRGMSREDVEKAFSQGRKIAYKHYQDGDGGWDDCEKPEFDWEEYDYTVFVDKNNPLPAIDIHTDNGPRLGNGPVTIEIGGVVVGRGECKTDGLTSSITWQKGLHPLKN